MLRFLRRSEVRARRCGPRRHGPWAEDAVTLGRALPAGVAAEAAGGPAGCGAPGTAHGATRRPRPDPVPAAPAPPTATPDPPATSPDPPPVDAGAGAGGAQPSPGVGSGCEPDLPGRRARHPDPRRGSSLDTGASATSDGLVDPDTEALYIPCPGVGGSADTDPALSNPTATGCVVEPATEATADRSALDGSLPDSRSPRGPARSNAPRPGDPAGSSREARLVRR